MTRNILVDTLTVPPVSFGDSVATPPSYSVTFYLNGPKYRNIQSIYLKKSIAS